MTQIWVREGVKQDTKALISLEDLAFGERAWPDRAIADSLDAPFVHVIFSGIANRVPLGFLVWRQIVDEAEILSIGVTPLAQGKGLGRAMLTYSQKSAAKKALGRMILEVDSQNAAALALYEGAGYHPIARRERYYRNGADAVIMARALRASKSQA